MHVSRIRPKPVPKTAISPEVGDVVWEGKMIRAAGVEEGFERKMPASRLAVTIPVAAMHPIASIQYKCEERECQPNEEYLGKVVP